MAVTAGGRPAWPRWRPAGLAWALWTLVMLGLPVGVWLNQLARQAGRSDLVGSDADTAIYGLVAVSAATVGMVLASRRPRRLFQQAIRSTRVMPVEVVTDRATTYPIVLDELLPAALHRTERYANNHIETDHGRLKARLRPSAASSRTVAPRSSSLGMGWCRTCAAVSTSWRSRRRGSGGWRWRSVRWPWRSERRRSSRLQPAAGQPGATPPAGVSPAG